MTQMFFFKIVAVFMGIFAFVCSSTLILKSQNVSKKVMISIFYESLCIDCTKFDRDQLYPLYSKIPEYIDIELVPYGNAQSWRNPDGSYNFHCQHGEEECYGNKLHSCALSKLPHELGLHFVACSMTSQNPARAGPNCAKSLNLTNPNFQWEQITICTEGSEGDDLLLRNGQRTNALSPPVEYVPWLLFNGVHSQRDNMESLKNLLAVVCRHLEAQGSNLPQECQVTGL